MAAGQQFGGCILDSNGERLLQGVQVQGFDGARRFDSRGRKPLVVSVVDLAFIGKNPLFNHLVSNKNLSLFSPIFAIKRVTK